MFKTWIYIITRKFALFPVAYQNMMLAKKGMFVMGVGSYGQPRIDQYKGSEAKVLIGNYTSIAPDVIFIAGGIHPVKTVSQYPFRSQFKLPGMYQDGNPSTKGNIIVGSDVWIGTNVIILSGVRIGNGAIIATNSLVTGDIPDYAIAMGSPAKVKGYRFKEAEIEELLKIAWWNWDSEKIKQAVDELTDEHVEKFIQKYKQK